MEWWQSGLSALVGVIVGGLFTYLGLRKQLEQQKEIDACSWRREVKNKPLLRLRDELAAMAVKAARVAKPGKNLTIPLEKTKEQEEEALKEAIRDWNSYILADDFDVVLNLQADFEIVKLVKEIRNKYLDTFSDITSGELQGRELGKARRAAEEEIAPKIAQAQELINKLLDEL